VIASVRGTVVTVGSEAAVVEVGGVGLAVQCTPATLLTLRPGEVAALSTSLVVREDSLTLYGFGAEDERAVFEILQTASGVGPRLAQAMLAVHAPDVLRLAVATDDYASLCLVPGIGKKGAQRICLELKEKLGVPSPASRADTGPPRSAGSPWREQLHAALLGLGWSGREADEALAAVAPEAEAALQSGVEPSVSGLLRSALRTLSRV
jgi:Holliday junction DNA helicase RuvA